MKQDLLSLAERVEALDGPDRRFFSKVRECPSGCWIWTGATNGSRQKRGCFWNGSKNVSATRWLFKRLNPEAKMNGRVVMHSCDRPLCVNPAHLSLGTQKDNMEDCSRKGRHAMAQPSVALRASTLGNAKMAQQPELRARGQRHGMSKLSDLDAETIRTSCLETKELADQFNVHRTTIQKIRRGALRKALRARAEEMNCEV